MDSANWGSIVFLDATMNRQNPLEILQFHMSGSTIDSAFYWGSTVIPSLSTTILTVGTSANVSFKFLNKSNEISIGSSPSGLEKGELYYTADGGGTGTLHIKL